MNETLIIISVIAITMLLLTIRRSNRRTIILTCGLTLGVLLYWVKIPIVNILGMVIYIISSFFIAVHGVKKKDLLLFEKVAISISGAFAFISNVFALMHWPYAYEIRLSMTFPILLYLFTLGRGMVNKNEFGFMTILNVDFLIKLFKIWI